MDSREMWVRLKTRRWVYSFSIVTTLALGILIGSVVSFGVKGKEGQKSSDATPLTIPAPQQLSNAFSQISKQLGQVDKWLDAAVAHADAKKFDPSEALSNDANEYFACEMYS